MQTITITELTTNELTTLIANAVIKEVAPYFQKISNKPVETWFDLDELCRYIPEKPAKATVYGWTHSSTIPYHKRAKKLFFLKSEIDAWLKKGRRLTADECDQEADNFLSGHKNVTAR